ncbi:MAG: ATP-binding protein [Lachnospiraceae bacterium]|nr:ATP-binding protein [Lachnospiraceae bacterium]
MTEKDELMDLLMTLSDSEIDALLRAVEKGAVSLEGFGDTGEKSTSPVKVPSGSSKKSAAPRRSFTRGGKEVVPSGLPSGRSEKWFDREVSGLPKEGLQLLRQLEVQMNMPGSSHNVDRKQLRYLKELRKMRLNVPSFFREGLEPRELYRRLRSFCEENDIPVEIVRQIVPMIVNYVETGYMRPVIFVGDKGCGKTTAVRMLFEAALQIPVKVIKVPQEDGGHGMTGDCGTYQSADAGCIAKARLTNHSLLVVYVFDEIDKVTHGRNRASVDDELLSITDSSNSDIYDNFLECSLVGLEHCPMLFTANDLSKVNPILADRCTVIRFPNADAERIKSIAKKYVDKELSNKIYRPVVFNYDCMNKAIDKLVDRNVTSIRKHQQMIEHVLQDVLNRVLEQDTDGPVEVTDEMFGQAVNSIMGTEARRIGFGA